MRPQSISATGQKKKRGCSKDSIAVGPHRTGGAIYVKAELKNALGFWLKHPGLMDLGSQINVISTKMACLLNLAPTGEPLPDASSFENCLPLQHKYLVLVQVCDSTGQVQEHLQYFYSCNTLSYHFILGSPWLETIGTTYHDWESQYWEYYKHQIELVSTSAFEKDLQQNPEIGIFAIMLHRTPGQWKVRLHSLSTDDLKSLVLKVYHEYLDVFSEKGAAMLPLLGRPEHAIETTGDPPRGPLYNLSNTQF